MTMTEEDAKTKWCPFARVGVGADYQTPTSVNRGWVPKADQLPEEKHLVCCIASSCAAWRWIKPIPRFKEGTMSVDPETLNLPPTHGYCGLAGKP